ncbi:MAG: PaaI family thioesterase [Roseinatronobacter sp.]
MSDQSRYDEIARRLPPFGQIFGIRVLQAHPNFLRTEIDVTEALSNRNGVLHGGAIMGLADNLGGTATFLNLSEGQGTTTLESKTNFLRAVPIGDTLTTETRPLHRGRRTHVWETRLIRSDGKLAAVVTQTQMVLSKDG